MKRLKAMSNREWVQRHEPYRVRDNYIGGVAGCPRDYRLQKKSANCQLKVCAECWNMPAKRNGKYIMKVVKE